MGLVKAKISAKELFKPRENPLDAQIIEANECLIEEAEDMAYELDNTAYKTTTMLRMRLDKLRKSGAVRKELRVAGRSGKLYLTFAPANYGKKENAGA